MSPPLPRLTQSQGRDEPPPQLPLTQPHTFWDDTARLDSSKGMSIGMTPPI
jgi:hypothetical protein